MAQQDIYSSCEVLAALDRNQRNIKGSSALCDQILN